MVFSHVRERFVVIGKLLCTVTESPSAYQSVTPDRRSLPIIQTMVKRKQTDPATSKPN
jgi:hypothetical protein